MLLEAQFRSRRSLNHVLYRDRRYRLLLDQATAAIAEGQSLTAFDQLLELSAADEDVFVWDESAGRPVSARASGRSLIERLTVDEQDRFERYVGTAAHGALESAMAAGDFAAILAVRVKFPGTAAARRATTLAASQLLDAGRAPDAAELWRQVVTAEGIRSLSDDELLQVCVTARMSGDETLCLAAMQASRAPIAVGDVALSLTAWMDSLPPVTSAEAGTSRTASPHWLTPGGAPGGDRAASGTPPFLMPIWTAAARQPLPDVKQPSADDVVFVGDVPADSASASDPAAAWRQACIDDDESPATAMSPLVVSGCIITREPSGLVGRRLDSGAVLWRHHCATWLDRSAAVATSPAPALTRSAAENTLQLTISTDGRRLYFIDSIHEPTTSPPPEESATETENDVRPQLVNCLVALELPDTSTLQSSTPLRRLPEAWRVGGTTDAAIALAGHYLLGTPIPVGDRLLVLSECNGQVNLICLQAETGRIEFVQGLALVDRPITAESDRVRLSFLPSIHDGLVIAPTPCGAVVAFDLDTRTLRWTAQYRALDTSVSNSWRGDGRPGATLHPVQPVITGPYVLLLPPDSVELIAWHLDSGERAWSRPRRGGQQIATAHGKHVLLASSDRVTGHALSTGDTLWEHAAGLIGGRGVVVGDQFFIPQVDGQILGLDTSTGCTRKDGPDILAVTVQPVDRLDPLLSTVVRPDATAKTDAAVHRLESVGNLVACGDWMISASPVETAAFGQAGPLLASRSSAAAAPADTAAEQLTLAELELTLSRSDAALPRLLRLTASGEPQVTGRLPDPVFERARRLLRELLYARLDHVPVDERDLTLDRLSSLADTATERARWNVAVAQQAAAQGNLNRWLAAAREIVSCPSDLLVTADVQRTRQLHPTAILQETRTSLLARLSTADHRRFAAAQSAAWQALSPVAESLELEQFIRCYGDGRSVDRARLQLARREQAAGTLVAAEYWLREMRAASGSTLDGSRRRLLNAIERPSRNQAVTIRSPAIVRAEFLPTFRGGRTVRDLGQSAVLQANWQTVALGWDIDVDWLRRDLPRVRLSAHVFPPDAPVTLPDLSALLESRREWTTESGSRLRILNLGDPRSLETPDSARPVPLPDRETAPQIELALVHRDTAEVASRIIVPARSRETPLQLQPADETYLPTADRELHCLSLRDGTRLWTASVAGDDRSEQVRIGPSGPGYCIVQVEGGIACLDPLNGAVRWQRRDIAPDAGLFGKEDSGLFGDSEHLVVVEGDQRTCRVFSTQSGQLLASTTLPTTDMRRTRIPFGSRLFYCTGGEEDPRVRLWDAATDRLVLDEPARYPVRQYRVDRRHVAYVNAAGEVVVLSALTGERVLRHALTENEQASLTEFAVYRDRELWHVQTSHAGQPSSGGRSENISSEVTIPAFNANGVLSVYDAVSHQRLWSRSLENYMVLQEPRREVPFLVALYRLRDGIATSAGNTTMEILDRRTGRVLGSLSDIATAKFCHASFDAERQEYSLYGRLSNGDLQRVDVHYELPTAGSLFAEN